MTLVGDYAMVAQRHMHQYGTTSEQLAEISVATRHHATRNPEAVAGDDRPRVPGHPARSPSRTSSARA